MDLEKQLPEMINQRIVFVSNFKNRSIYFKGI